VRTIIRNTILHGHVLNKLAEIPENSIDAIVTSPPYWGLRDYGLPPIIWDSADLCDHKWGKIIYGKKTGRNDANSPTSTNFRGSNKGFGNKSNTKGQFCIKCHAWRGQLGLEPHYELFIQHLVTIFNACRGPLKPGGCLWVNLGDSYSAGETLKRKTLIGIPDRFKIAMIDSGWIFRNDVIWHKPDCLPSSAKDRFTNDYERFFFFTQQPKYYFQRQFESYSESFKNDKRIQRLKDGETLDHKPWKDYSGQKVQNPASVRDRIYKGIKKYGRNKRTTWRITTKPFKDAHFAIFPRDLVEIPIRACVPPHICSQCGRQWKKEPIVHGVGDIKKSRNPRINVNKGIRRAQEITGSFIDKCTCNAQTDRGIVLDPFFGSGTVAIEAMAQEKDWVGIELNVEYIAIAQKRIEEWRKKQPATLKKYF